MVWNIPKVKISIGCFLNLGAAKRMLKEEMDVQKAFQPWLATFQHEGVVSILLHVHYFFSDSMFHKITTQQPSNHETK